MAGRWVGAKALKFHSWRPAKNAGMLPCVVVIQNWMPSPHGVLLVVPSWALVEGQLL